MLDQLFSAKPVQRAGDSTIHDRDGDRFLVTAPIRGGAGELAEQLRAIVDELRVQTGLDHLERFGLDFGFRIEDLVRLRVRCRRDEDRDEVTRRLARLTSPDCRLTVERSPLVGPGLVEAEGIFRKFRRAPYRRVDGRVRIEAFELHVVEHCNLRCRHCCNMSPYLDRHVLSVEEIAAQCRRMAEHVTVDVFKIMGGEPLLHPDITAVLLALRETGISDVIRLFTNGLLLARQPDAFWRALDHLTVSSYSSAPVAPADLALIREKAAAFDVVLNVKTVDRFSQVLSSARHADEAVVQSTYDQCWLRHRCLIVRNGAFFKCTRSAYFQDFQERLDIPERDPDPAGVRARDGVPLDAPDFDGRLLAYLNDARPLESCRYCLGSSGPLTPHAQLSKIDVRRGRL